LFTSAAETINTLTAAQAAHRLKDELKKHLRPDLLIIDELGFLTPPSCITAKPSAQKDKATGCKTGASPPEK